MDWKLTKYILGMIFLGISYYLLYQTFLFELKFWTPIIAFWGGMLAYQYGWDSK